MKNESKIILPPSTLRIFLHLCLEFELLKYLNTLPFLLDITLPPYPQPPNTDLGKLPLTPTVHNPNSGAISTSQL